jgi:hypothetical protein
MTNPVCGNCKFFYRGTCRRNPPQLILEPQNIQYGAPYLYVPMSWHPAVDEHTGWCGEFKERSS